jgi:predicted nucleic acid-binding protein
MNIVVDTNIVFSALMSSNTKMGQILFTDKTDIDFFAPELLLFEIEKYFQKLCHHSKLTPSQILESKNRIFGRINES